MLIFAHNGQGDRFFFLMHFFLIHFFFLFTKTAWSVHLRTDFTSFTAKEYNENTGRRHRRGRFARDNKNNPMSFNLSSDSNTTTSLSTQNQRCVILDDSLAVQICQFLALSIVLLAGLAGNILILLTVPMGQKLKKTVNYFILNMAVSDLLYPLTIIPLRLTEIISHSLHWFIPGTAGLVLCKIVRFAEHLSISVSVQSLMWIALDRFLAVVFPMKVYLISPKFRTTAIIASWIIAGITNSTDLFSYGLLKENKELTQCIYFENKTDLNFINGKAHIYIFHVLPIIALMISYCIIVVTLKKRDKLLGPAVGHSPNSKQDRRKRQAITMSLCIMALFCICTIPLTAQNVIDLYKINVPCKVYRPVRFISYLIYYMCSAVNPIICFAFVQSYRDSLRKLIKSCLDSCLKKFQR